MMVLFKFCFNIFIIFLVFAHGTISQERSTIGQISPQSSSSNSNLSRSLIANFELNGIRGYALFTQNGSNTIINAQITGGLENEAYQWKIYSMPHHIDDSSCSSLSIGTPIHGMDLTLVFGPLRENEEMTFSANNVQLVDGGNSILGRTLLLRGNLSGRISCATLLPLNNKIIFQSKFHSPINGAVSFIQTENTTIVASELSYSNGTRIASTNKWTLMAGTNEDVTFESQYRHEMTQCSAFRGQPLLMNMPDPDPINIGLDPIEKSGKSFITLHNLTQMNEFPIIYMVIFSEFNLEDVVACAALTLITRKTAAVKFNFPQVRGTITFSQDTYFDPTIVEINIQLFQNAYSYGIDELPKIIRSKDETSKSCPNIRSIIYNPKHTDPDLVPTEGHGTTDQYAIGDLSGKYGNLMNKNSETFEITDYNLPLFGRFSIVGRALVIYSPNGPAIACANIEYTGINITTAFATFDTPIQGQFIFRQPSRRCGAETSVYLEISKPGEDNATKTINHLWDIHRNTINSGDTHWSSSNCSISGSLYNPYNVSTHCIYSRDCTQNTPLRCELGDASSKLGPIDIPKYKVTEDGELDIGKYFFTDEFLPLCGPTSIISKSIVIHGPHFENLQIACANVIEYKPRVKSRS